MKRFIFGALLLAGCGAATPATPATLVASQSHVVFDPLFKRNVSDRIVLRFTNTGDERTPPLQVMKTGDAQFVLDQDLCNDAVVAPGKHCELTVLLGGVDSGEFSGLVRVYAWPLISSEVSLSGKVRAPELALTTPTTSIDIPAGHKPPLLSFTLQNVGGGTTGPITLTSDQAFPMNGSCAGASLVGGAECVFTVQHNWIPFDQPTAALAGFVRAAAAPGGESRLDFQLVVTPPRTLGMTDYSWDNVGLNVRSTHVFDIVNPGPSILDGFVVQITDDAPHPGAAPSFALESETCSTMTVAAGHRCTITVAATGAQIGTFTGKLKVSSFYYQDTTAKLTATVR